MKEIMMDKICGACGSKLELYEDKKVEVLIAPEQYEEQVVCDQCYSDLTDTLAIGSDKKYYHVVVCRTGPKSIMEVGKDSWRGGVHPQPIRTTKDGWVLKNYLLTVGVIAQDTQGAHALAQLVVLSTMDGFSEVTNTADYLLANMVMMVVNRPIDRVAEEVFGVNWQDKVFNGPH